MFVEQVVVCSCGKYLAPLDYVVLSQVEFILVLGHWFNLKHVVKTYSSEINCCVHYLGDIDIG